MAMTTRSKPGDYYTDFVGRVLALLEPDRTIRVGEWVDGPDGRRDMDVEVRGTLNGQPHFYLVERKDWDRPVGIQVIDALDSKRTDLAADRAIIYSNSGFTEPAIKKAKSVAIELASALCEHDPKIAYSGRIRAVIPAGPGHRFRNDAGAKSGTIRALIPS
jgi:Restriction endonuclease